MKLGLMLVFLSSFAAAQQGGYLSAKDQKYYKNDSFEGNNQRERIDSAVIEINKLHGEIASLKAQMQDLRKEVEDLKKVK